MASYLNPHPKTGWRYQRGVPKDLQPIVGKKVSVKYIPAMPRREAEKHARAYAVKDDERWSKLRSQVRQLSAEEVRDLVRNGGLAYRPFGSISCMEEWLEETRAEINETSKSDPYQEAKIDANLMLPANPTPEDIAYWQDHMRPEYIALWSSDELERLRENEGRIVARLKLLRKVSPATSEYSLDELFKLWVKVREPKTTRKQVAIIRLFKKVVGDVDYRTVTQTDSTKFRDHLDTMGIIKPTQHNYLAVMKALFSAAVSANKIPSNPIFGVRVHGNPRHMFVEGKKLPFTGAEERLILEKAAETKFGGERHGDVMWILLLLIWTGARPREIAQLRKPDVYVESGVPLIHIREDYQFQSVKTSRARKVPLHSAVADFVTYANKASDDFVFGSFSHDKNNGRCAWVVNNFGKFLRETCGITEPKKTLYSFRHRFIDATRDAGMSTEMSKALVGHRTGDVHGNYGRGAGLITLAEAVETLNPLKDRERLKDAKTSQEVHGEAS
jgi:integrase